MSLQRYRLLKLMLSAKAGSGGQLTPHHKFGADVLGSPLYCINNQHDFQGRGKDKRNMLHNKT